MEALLWGVAGGAALLFLWGLLWPRGFWRVFVSWSHRDPGTTEPSGAGYTAYRVLSGVGIVALVLSGSVAWQRDLEAQPPPPPPPNVIELMWGEPVPIVLDRVVTPTTRVPRGMTQVPVLAYQAIDGERRKPSYPFSLERWPTADDEVPEGLLGEAARRGFAALDDARVMLHVQADPSCIPRRVVAYQGGDIIRVAVYFSKPLLENGKEDPESVNCAAGGSDSASLLIPMRLTSILGARLVRDLDGGGIRKAPVLVG